MTLRVVILTNAVNICDDESGMAMCVFIKTRVEATEQMTLLTCELNRRLHIYFNIVRIMLQYNCSGNN